VPLDKPVSILLQVISMDKKVTKHFLLYNNLTSGAKVFFVASLAAFFVTSSFIPAKATLGQVPADTDHDGVCDSSSGVDYENCQPSYCEPDQFSAWWRTCHVFADTGDIEGCQNASFCISEGESCELNSSLVDCWIHNNDENACLNDSDRPWCFWVPFGNPGEGDCNTDNSYPCSALEESKCEQGSDACSWNGDSCEYIGDSVIDQCASRDLTACSDDNYCNIRQGCRAHWELENDLETNCNSLVSQVSCEGDLEYCQWEDGDSTCHSNWGYIDDYCWKEQLMIVLPRNTASGTAIAPYVLLGPIIALQITTPTSWIPMGMERVIFVTMILTGMVWIMGWITVRIFTIQIKQIVTMMA